jgi:hypothetical protein
VGIFRQSSSRVEVTERQEVTEESGILPSGGVNLSKESAGPYAAEGHDLHCLHRRCHFFFVLAIVPAEVFSGGRSLCAIHFDRKRICILNRFRNRFSMASHKPVAWTDLGARCLVLVLWA